MSLWTVNDTKLELNFHPGQSKAWHSTRRFIAVLAGTGGGKTSFGPWWLWREIREQGEGDYLAVTASYDLFKLRMLPTLQDTFTHTLRLGKYYPSDRILDLPSLNARIILRSAESEGGLESSVAKAAWLDEAGQESFDIGTWEAVLRRLGKHQGRALLTTTVYNMGWLKSAVYDRWLAGDKDFDVIQFDSTANPSYPRAEYERARESMPVWKFNMFYRGMFERPAGLIYDSFDETRHKVPRFPIPDHWERYLGLDFGGVNTAGLFYAEDPATRGIYKPDSEVGKLYLYREYRAGGLSMAEHAAALRKGEPMIPFAVGGSHSEGQWRQEIAQGGLPVNPPDIKDVELGIQRVYAAHKRDQIVVFDDMVDYLDHKLRYAYKLDPATGQVKEPLEIADKATFHPMDAERYIIGKLCGGTSEGVYF